MGVVGHVPDPSFLRWISKAMRKSILMSRSRTYTTNHGTATMIQSFAGYLVLVPIVPTRTPSGH